MSRREICQSTNLILFLFLIPYMSDINFYLHVLRKIKFISSRNMIVKKYIIFNFQILSLRKNRYKNKYT